MSGCLGVEGLRKMGGNSKWVQGFAFSLNDEHFLRLILVEVAQETLRLLLLGRGTSRVKDRNVYICYILYTYFYYTLWAY